MPDWDRHYLTKEVGEQTPANVLTGNDHLLPATGKVLDYACGLAANGCWLAHRGYDVTVWDKSAVAINKIKQYSEQYLLNIKAETKDLESSSLVTEEQFDVLVVGFFLHRPTIENLKKYLKPEGLLFYQTFSGQRINDRGPSNPEFRLGKGELLTVFSDMNILYYREDQQYGNEHEGIRDQALIVAAKKN
jgi:tellurite methyltransferase